jgi:beta-galactosidase beta subunit
MIYLAGEGTNIPLRAGDFMITLPQDAHMPCVKLGEESVLCAKLVAKIKL